MRLPPAFDMTVTRAEFVRLLPAAVGCLDFVSEAEEFRQGDAVRGWRIRFVPLPPLRIGLVRLERHRVELSFTGLSVEEKETFMARFELHFRRGGG